MPYTYDFEMMSVTVDCVVFGLDSEDLKILLIQRDPEPYSGMWALPGGFLKSDETLEEAARRELSEETSLRGIFLEQLYTFGDIHRDPRGRVISVAYYALVNIDDHKVKSATDARNAAWFSVADTPALAFDHEKILTTALERLKGKVRYQPIGFELLPPLFTLSRLQKLYETILETTLDKRNFRRKILAMNLLEETDQIEQDVAHRAARLYRFNRKRYSSLLKKGFTFEV